MQRIKNITRKFMRDEEGATMVEYGLMLALIAIVCILAITAVGTNTNLTFSCIRDALSTAVGG
jgi:pilus assembly protein Flp/PilA